MKILTLLKEKIKSLIRKTWIILRKQRSFRLSAMGCLSLAAICSCHGPMHPDRYAKWITDPENGFRQIVTSGAYQLDVQYQSANYLMIRNGTGVPDENAGRRHYFMLEITPLSPGYDLIARNDGDPSVIQKRRDYFSFQFEKDMTLTADGQVRTCNLFHMENTFNIKNGRTFLMAFEKGGADSNLELQIESPLISSQRIVFTFDLTREPEIKL